MYIPLNVKSHYSLLSSVITPKAMKGREKFVICDNNTVSGAVQFKSQYPHCGLGINIKVENKGDLAIISKNYNGWKQLIKISSAVNSKDYLNKEVPYSLIEGFYTDDLIFIYSYWENDVVKNYWYGIDLTKNNQYIREVHPEKCIAFHTNIINTPDQLHDLEILYCIKDNIILDRCREKYPELFKSNIKYHIMTREEMLSSGYTESELDNTEILFSQIEPYTITKDPILPKFDCGGESSNSYLLNLCNEGLKKKVFGRGLDEQKYIDRMKYELSVITDFDLSDYFLMVRDIIVYVEQKYHLTSIRGSAAGCLVSYLIDLSKIDPIEYNLIFERFINPGRGKSLPDIDLDVPADNREEVLNYIQDKYGKDNVGQISTYQTIKASAALKAVFRTNPRIDFAEVNLITKKIPEQSKVADRLKDMPEDERSLIKFAMLENPDDFSQWCYIERGELKGEYGKMFEQAIRLEGLKSAKSKHAAGIIISPDVLENVCPTRYDSETGLIVCDMEMDDLAALGGLKLDILGLRLFSRIVDISNDLKMEYVF